MSDKIIGIDLGTTTTEAAFYRDGKAKMLKNPEGSVITPSAVGLDENGNLVIGARARAQYELAPERTAIEIKRKIGTKESICLGEKSYTATELSSLLLRYVKDYASEALGEEISRAVISVPAYFDDLQRREVMEAGKMAGFTVERIINEPTAAALSYGISHMDEESYLLVYDLGGGTFDVTLLEMFEGVLEVKASAGDNQLGGKDFDDRLANWLRERFEKANGLSLEGDVYALARLKEQAEKCKIALSTQESASVEIPLLAQKDGVPLALEETVSREQFEALIRDLVGRTHNPIRRVLEDAGISADELSGVLLVGGSTRVPLVAQDIGELLGVIPGTAIDPDLSVASGAAIEAGILSGAIDPSQELVMTDVCPYTLGVQVWDGETVNRMSVLIPRNTTIPVTKTERYYTSFPGQQRADVAVYQGESRDIRKNHFLGDFIVTDIPMAAAREEAIDVSFSYNQNGILNVRASVVSTGKEASIVIDLFDETPAEKLDISQWKKAPNALDYRSVIRRAEKALRKLQEDGIYPKEAAELDTAIYQLKIEIIRKNLSEADELEEEIEEILEFLDEEY